MKKSITAVCILLCVCSSKISIAQSKVAVVSVEDIFGMMPEAKKADSLLMVFQKELADNYAYMQKELSADIEKFYIDSVNMTLSLKNIKKTDFQNRISSLSGKEQQNNSAIDAEREKLVKPIREKLIKAVQDVAKENGYTHVAYKDQMIVYPPGDDITDKVKKKLGIK
ncbi:OmpH family outer membrane protein [Ferruginibacter sp. SUN106]|uniref:OmpH family outer membrane protein n=1 Tax=Ferruginibacter sp. SUN106 TaxID=2978348 RepID=UPI003D361E5A